jgi:hypothetical protein
MPEYEQLQQQINEIRQQVQRQAHITFNLHLRHPQCSEVFRIVHQGYLRQRAIGAPVDQLIIELQEIIETDLLV